MKAKLLAVGLRATAILLFIALLAQAPHAAEVFLRIGPAVAGWEFYLIFAGAWLYAIALESATAFFVWKEQTRLAFAFAAISVAHNLCYYMPDTAIATWPEVMTFRYVVSSLLVSISLPVAIAAFSHVQASAKKVTTATADDTAVTAIADTSATAATAVTTAVTATAVDVAEETATATAVDRKPAQNRNRKNAIADGKMTKEQRVMHVAESGNFDVESVMSQFAVGRRTAEGIVAEARKLFRNDEVAVAQIAVQLPQLVTVSTNGHNGNGAH